MFFGKSDKDVRLSDSQYKKLVKNMGKRERKEFDRKQKQLQRERDDDWLLGMLFLIFIKKSGTCLLFSITSSFYILKSNSIIAENMVV